MSPPIFLDTARMGRAFPAATASQMDLAKYWAVNGLSAEFDLFLREGISAIASGGDYPALFSWGGIAELLDALRTLSGLGSGWKTLVGNRSSKLVEVPIALLRNKPQRNMCFRSLWPQYRDQLISCGETFIFDDDSICEKHFLAEAAADFFAASGCRGLFIPAVTHFGRVVPYAEIINNVMRKGNVELILVDGAQDFCHKPLQTIAKTAPVFYVTCSQKWMRSGLPAAIAFVSAHFDWDEVSRIIDLTDDPLLQFVCGRGADNCFGETVAVTSLFAMRAAVNELGTDRISESYNVRMSNRKIVLDLLSQGKPFASNSDLDSSGIVTIQLDSFRNESAASTRQRFLELGVVLSAFPRGMIRMSMPDTEFTSPELTTLDACMNNIDLRVCSATDKRFIGTGKQH